MDCEETKQGSQEPEKLIAQICKLVARSRELTARSKPPVDGVLPAV
jgi:hypothetical protein